MYFFVAVNGRARDWEGKVNNGTNHAYISGWNSSCHSFHSSPHFTINNSLMSFANVSFRFVDSLPIARSPLSFACPIFLRLTQSIQSHDTYSTNRWFNDWFRYKVFHLWWQWGGKDMTVFRFFFHIRSGGLIKALNSISTHSLGHLDGFTAQPSLMTTCTFGTQYSRKCKEHS